MKRKYYIAYGSNLNTEQMLFRCPDARVVGSTTLNGYELTFRGNSRSGVANIEPCIGASVPVGVWSISPSDEEALDLYEGFPRLYTKHMFLMQIDGETVDGMAYVMTKGHEIAPPSDYYLRTIMEGYRDFGFDTEPLMDAAEAAKKGA